MYLLFHCEFLKFKKKLRLVWNLNFFHTFAPENQEEKFELIATSIKNAKAVTLLL